MKRLHKLAPFLILLLSLSVFLPALENELSDWDDRFNIADNPCLSQPPFEGLGNLLGRFYGYDYYPVFYGSLWLDHLFWGNNPFGYHLSNVLLHACNVLLVFCLGLRLSKKYGFRAAIAASLLFAIHPLNVEPVAWVTGRKTLLFSLFALCSLLTYIKNASGGSKSGLRFIPSILFFILACLSNVYAVIVPFLIVTYDIVLRKKSLLLSVRSKWIFWLLAIAAVILKMAGRWNNPHVHKFHLWANTEWLLSTIGNFGQNTISIFFPLRLNARYPDIIIKSPFEIGFLTGVLLLIIMLATVWRKKTEIVYPILWFVIGLIPTSQLLRHNILRADRYLYLPGIGIYLLFGLIFTSWAGKTRIKKTAGLICLSGIVLSFLILTEQRIRIWRNNRTLFTDSLTKEPLNSIALNNLGLALAKEGKLKEAVSHYTKALLIVPSNTEAHYNLGNALTELGRFDEAIARYHKALRYKPEDPGTHNNLGLALAKQGRLQEAIDSYHEALRYDPDNIEANNNIGVALAQQGNFDEAVSHFSKAISANPEYAAAHTNLGKIFTDKGLFEEAISHYTEALRINPRDIETHCRLARILSTQNKLDKAISHYHQALRLKPNDPEIYNNLGTACAKQGKLEEAVTYFTEALRLQPDYAEIHLNLGRALLKQGKRQKANTHFEVAQKLLKKSPKGATACAP